MLFIGGLAASLLPCVYPLYPITINFLRARGSSNKMFHPIVYYGGIVIMYTIFGIVAGLTGGAFNEIMRFPATNIAIAGLLVLLGLAAADWLHIPFLSGGNAEVKKSGPIGTFLMGLSAGMLSSACVGPVVVSILIGVVANTTRINAFAVANSSFKMMIFGMGLGLPLLLLGIFGMRLPRAGKWMLFVQIAFAILIIYFAYGYLEKGLLSLDFTAQEIQGVAMGLIIFVLAAYQLQNKSLYKHQRMQNALYGLSLTISVLILFRAFAPDVVAQSGTPTQESIAKEQHGNLTWYLEQEAAYEEARKTGKYVLLDFYGNWCSNCKAFQELTLKNEALNKALQNAVLVKIYDTSPAFEAYKNDPDFPELKLGLPFFVITDAEGNVLYKTSDYQDYDEMVLFLS